MKYICTMHGRPANKVIHIQYVTCSGERRTWWLPTWTASSCPSTPRGRRSGRSSCPPMSPASNRSTFLVSQRRHSKFATTASQFLLTGRGLSLVAVALASNHVLIYDDKNIVDHFKVGVSFFICFFIKHKLIMSLKKSLNIRQGHMWLWGIDRGSHNLYES